MSNTPTNFPDNKIGNLKSYDGSVLKELEIQTDTKKTKKNKFNIDWWKGDKGKKINVMFSPGFQIGKDMFDTGGFACM